MTTPTTGPQAEHTVLTGCLTTFVVGSIVFMACAPKLIGWLADGINGFGALMRGIFGS